MIFVLPLLLDIHKTWLVLLNSSLLFQSYPKYFEVGLEFYFDIQFDKDFYHSYVLSFQFIVHN